jgi:protein-tyrosine phosphatase
MTMAAPLVHIFDVGDYDAQITRAAGLLNAGGLVALPMETVYGLAARLDNPEAVARLRALLPSHGTKPFTIHLPRRQEAERYLGPISDLGQRMMKKLWPGPVALVFEVPPERRRAVAAELKLAESDLYDGESVTLRCPDHIVATDVIAQVPGPVVAAAAPGDGRADDVAEALEGKAELVLDAGPARYAKPSTIIRINKQQDGYKVVRAGVYDERIIEKLLRTTIVFVCSGNTCRSPMAEAIARRVLADKLHVAPEQLETKGISVLSAGSFAMPGARATPQAVEAVRDLGADLSRHRSRPLTVELIHQADVVYTMGHAHSQAVTALVPSAADRVVTLDASGDIEDPIGGDVGLYRQLAGQLQTLIERRLQEQGLP